MTAHNSRCWQRSERRWARLACPSCGHHPASRAEALRQREDLAIVWLHQDHPSGPISQHRHCATCQPHVECDTVECVDCGDGPILTGVLVQQLREHDVDRPTALRAWFANAGWQLEPDLLCPNHNSGSHGTTQDPVGILAADLDGWLKGD